MVIEAVVTGVAAAAIIVGVLLLVVGAVLAAAEQVMFPEVSFSGRFGVALFTIGVCLLAATTIALMLGA